MKLASTILLTGLLAAAVTTAPTPSSAQISKSGKKYVLRMKWSKGQKLNYNIAMAMGGQKPMNMGLSYYVKSVKGKSGVLEVTASAPGGQPTTETVTVDERGRLSGGSASMNGNVLEYPAGAIGIGESWTTDATFPGAPGGLKGKAKNTLKGVRKVNGKEYMHIESKMNAKGTQVTASGVNNVLVGMADGQILRSTMKMDITVDNNGQKQTMNMVVTLTRK